MTTLIDYPPNEQLAAAVRARGVAHTARVLGISRQGLAEHMRRNDLPTKADPRKLGDDAMKRLAELV